MKVLKSYRFEPHIIELIRAHSVKFKTETELIERVLIATLAAMSCGASIEDVENELRKIAMEKVLSNYDGSLKKD